MRTKDGRYEIGLLVNVRVESDPPDMFWAQYLRLGVSDNYDMNTILELAENEYRR